MVEDVQYDTSIKLLQSEPRERTKISQKSCALKGIKRCEHSIAAHSIQAGEKKKMQYSAGFGREKSIVGGSVM